MSWTYSDDLDEAIYKWDKLPEGTQKKNLAYTLLQRYLTIRQEDCGHMRLPSAYDIPDEFKIRPHIPKELK